MSSILREKDTQMRRNLWTNKMVLPTKYVIWYTEFWSILFTLLSSEGTIIIYSDSVKAQYNYLAVMIHRLTLSEHKDDPATYSRRGQCWFTPLPLEDTMMVHSEGTKVIHSIILLVICSLTLWDHTIAYPLRVHWISTHLPYTQRGHND